DPEENRNWRIKDEPSARLILKEINGYHAAGPVVTAGMAGGFGAAVASPESWRHAPSLKEAASLTSFAELKDDGSTASGAWIYTGVFAGGKNHAADRKGDDWVALGWGFSWPANRRLMYNRASADPDGVPWEKEARLAREHGPRGPDGRPLHRGYVYWDARKRSWVGVDVPD